RPPVRSGRGDRQGSGLGAARARTRSRAPDHHHRGTRGLSQLRRRGSGRDPRALSQRGRSAAAGAGGRLDAAEDRVRTRFRRRDPDHEHRLGRGGARRQRGHAGPPVGSSEMVAVGDRLKGRSFTRVADWSRDDLLEVLDVADELKRLQQLREEHHLLPGRTLGMIFHKPSTRTRVSFEVGIYELGGLGLYLSAGDLQLGRGETIRDTATVLSRYLDAIMIRTFAQSDVDELAEHASIPVINGLTDSAHPCQALADVMTIRERFGRLEGLKVAYLGDGNNVCASLMVASSKLGLDFVAATPPAYGPDEEAVRIAREAGGSVELIADPRDAVEGADVLYTDIWTSMGQEEERERRLND